jgi:hypothetical protein
MGVQNPAGQTQQRQWKPREDLIEPAFRAINVADKSF